MPITSGLALTLKLISHNLISITTYDNYIYDVKTLNQIDMFFLCF